MRAADLIGQTFGWLYVAARHGSLANGQATWDCVCACGKEVASAGGELRLGKRTSCGCAWSPERAGGRQCARCKSVFPAETFRRIRTRGGEIIPYCAACIRERGREQYRRHTERTLAREKQKRSALRAEVIGVYGGKCACCGENDHRFLAIDHVHGGGSRQRRSIGAGDTFYKWLRKAGYPDDFQLLCCNCNWGKHINGICPHMEWINVALVG